jgi:hypothetical protein
MRIQQVANAPGRWVVIDHRPTRLIHSPFIVAKTKAEALRVTSRALAAERRRSSRGVIIMDRDDWRIW